MSFADHSEDYAYDVPSTPDPTFCIADTTDDDLGNFFSRPIKIQSYSWTTGNGLFQKFNPWEDFFTNKRVINRIANYHLLRCKLHVKIVLNGNGFHYGRAIASYIPLDSRDTFTVDRAYFIEDVIAASQRPHIYLDPTNSQGGTMTLPFLWPANALDIPGEDWDDMGTMVLHSLQDLKHANGATDSVTISVFAWASDVSLSIPTSAEPASIEAQAGEFDFKRFDVQGDEYDESEGKVSKPANAIARAAGKLSDAPFIGAYMKATELAASSVGAIAKIFGMSRPVSTEPIHQYTPRYLGNLASADAGDTSLKLTYDTKQELSIDTRTMGLDGTDEMSIKSIATRESYITQFPWTVADTTETLLWNAEVSPVIWDERSGDPETEVHMPACCFASLPFRHWRGTMKYRFQVVASAFHKGRLKITYDPHYAVTNEYNTNYTHVIDLAKERDFTVEIGWGQPYTYIKHSRPGTDSVIFGTSAITTDPRDTANGIVSVYVVNELTVPNSTPNNDVAINVFVSAGDDFEVANPDESYTNNLSWYAEQAGVLDIEAIDSLHHRSDAVVDFSKYRIESGEVGNSPDDNFTMEESAPMQNMVAEQMGPTLTEKDHSQDVFFADPVVSVRQVLKRYNYYCSFFPDTSTAVAMAFKTWTMPNLPAYRGWCATLGALHESALPSDPTPYNYTKMTMLNYFLPAYASWRGGVRWKYHMVGMSDSTDGKAMIKVTREPNPLTGYGSNQTSLIGIGGSVSARAKQMMDVTDVGHAGCAVSPVEQNPVLEVEIPFQTQERFGPAKQSNQTGTVTDTWYHRLSVLFTGGESSPAINTQVQAYCSVGEDFTLGMYLGPPIGYYYSDPTPA